MLQYFFGDSSTKEVAGSVEEVRSKLQEGTVASDQEVQRFLTACKNNNEQAAAMLDGYHVWYHQPFTGMEVRNPELRPCDLGTAETDEKEDKIAPFLSASYQAADLRGYPIYWEKIGYAALHWSEFRVHFTDDELILRHIRFQELCRRRMETRNVSRVVLVLDLKHIPVVLDWPMLWMMKRIGDLDKQYYPETLHILFTINTPSYFSALWAMIRPFMEPATQEKVRILGEDFYEELSKEIAPENIPVEYGGTRSEFSWTWPTNFEE